MDGLPTEGTTVVCDIRLDEQRNKYKAVNIRPETCDECGGCAHEGNCPCDKCGLVHDGLCSCLHCKSAHEPNEECPDVCDDCKEVIRPGPADDHAGRCACSVCDECGETEACVCKNSEMQAEQDLCASCNKPEHEGKCTVPTPVRTPVGQNSPNSAPVALRLEGGKKQATEPIPAADGNARSE